MFDDLPQIFFSKDDDANGTPPDPDPDPEQENDADPPDPAPEDDDDPFAGLSADERRDAHKELEEFRKAKAKAKVKPTVKPKAEQKPTKEADGESDDETEEQPDPVKERADRRLKVKASISDVCEELDVSLYSGALKDAIAAGDFDKIGLDDEDEPDAEQMADVLKELIKRKPWLVKKGAPVTTNGRDTGRGQTVISDDDIAAGARKYGIGR